MVKYEFLLSLTSQCPGSFRLFIEMAAVIKGAAHQSVTLGLGLTLERVEIQHSMSEPPIRSRPMVLKLEKIKKLTLKCKLISYIFFI